MASNIPPPDETSEVQVDDAILRAVSRETVTQWQELGRLLQIPQWQLDAIQLQYQANSPVEAAYRMLEKWRQASATNATVFVLAERIKELRRRDIARKILKMPPESSHGNSYPNQSQERSEAADGLVNNAIFELVKSEIGKKWMNLGRGLNILDIKLDSIDERYSRLEEKAYWMLCAWRQVAASDATVSVLAAHLEVIGMKDLATEILKMPPESSHGNCYPKQLQERSEAEWLEKLRNKLCAKYETYVMKGLPCMGNIRISLADYVDASVETDDSDNTRMPLNRRKGRSTNGASAIVGRNSNSEESEDSENSEEAELEEANEVFQSAFSSHKRPLRVLVEGPPGYGKTTLSAKLCFDHAASADYMQNFDLVLHFPLRTFEGSLEGMLCRAADLEDSNEREIFLGILNNPSTRILLVLDGFDEVAQQHVNPILALLQGQRFPHVAVVVTSRPGQFTFERWEKENDGCAAQCVLTRDWNRLWQSRITILGINKEMTALFIEKHLAGFPENIRREVSYQLQQLEKNKIVESKFLECPLFLLMIILLATDDETGGIHNLRTPTDLYKSVFNLIIQRYCSKQNEPVNEKVDLFTVIEAPRKPFYVDLLCQFGEFALWALTEKNLSFSQQEILGSDPPRDPRILQLGLLTQSVSTVGFREKVVYEPVHKSLLEFSAAYALWLQCPERDRAGWAEKVVRLWRCTRSEPSCLMMLAGLMRDSFLALLDAFNPYASCGVWEQWLRRSVSEIDLTESVLSTLTPFLPTHWEDWRETCFSRTQHDALLLQGIRQGIIKRVTLLGFLATAMPDDVVVDTAQFSRIQDTVENVHKFNCRRLVFDDSDVSRGLATWIPSTINFQTLALQFSRDASSDLGLLRSALTAGALKDIQIQISCAIVETASVVALTELIEMEKLKALSLDVESSGSEELNGLLRAAANSSQLTTLSLDLWGISVDLCHLCGGVQKTWQFLSISGCDIDFPPQTDQTLQANCFALDCPIRPAVLRFLEVCQVTSLQCTTPLLAAIATLPLLPQHLTELNVFLDRTTEQCRLPHLPNLTVLILTLTYWRPPGSFAVRDFLFGSRSFLRLKGIEIWLASENRELSVELVKCVCDCLEQSSPVPSFQGTPRSSHSLQLQYFLLQSHYRYEVLAPLGDMAAHLRNKSLSRLDIVTEEQPWSPNVVDLFSPAQGFRVETGVWGTRSEDTILRRMQHDTQPLLFFNCYSIRHTD